MFSCGWLWLYVGAFLMLAELLASGFIVFFFGLAAVSVGVLRLILGDAFTPTWQLVAISFFSIFYLAIVRRWLKKIFVGSMSSSRVDFDNDFVGRVGRVVEAINPPLEGRVELGDAAWSAVAESPIAKDANVKVISQTNLTLKVEEVK